MIWAVRPKVYDLISNKVKLLMIYYIINIEVSEFEEILNYKMLFNLYNKIIRFDNKF